jgi:hypothetical protein
VEEEQGVQGDAAYLALGGGDVERVQAVLAALLEEPDRDLERLQGERYEEM